MTCSNVEAEDIVLNAWLRWQRRGKQDVREPAAFLTRTVTRLCLRVLRLFAGLRGKLGVQAANSTQPTWIDGLPGYVSRERDGVLQTTALAIEDGLITAVYITRNPDKLRRIASAMQTHGPPALLH